MKKGLTIGVLVTLVIAAGIFSSGRNAEAPLEVIDNSNEETIPMNKEQTTMTLTSAAFAQGERIPAKYTCDGDNVSPPLAWSGVPEGTQSLVLIMDDPDIPAEVVERIGSDTFDHWVLYGIDPSLEGLAEGESSGSEGLSSRGTPGFVGSCPPDREHRYFYKLYALDAALNFIKAPTKAELESAMEGHIIAEAQLMGIYERTN